MIVGECRNIAIVNYIADVNLLRDMIPPGYEINLHNGQCYLSLVAYTFSKPKFIGIKLPKRSFHVVCLRSYIRAIQPPYREGIINIREMVSGKLVAIFNSFLFDDVARAIPMWNSSKKKVNSRTLKYIIKRKRYHTIRLKTAVAPEKVKTSDDAFFFVRETDLFCGTGRDTLTAYACHHPVWNIFPVKDHSLNIKFGKLFGKEFRSLNDQEPVSVYLAEGSSLAIKPRPSRRPQPVMGAPHPDLP